MPEGAGNPNPDPNPNPNPNKVYNGSGGHQVKTGKVMDNTDSHPNPNPYPNPYPNPNPNPKQVPTAALVSPVGALVCEVWMTAVLWLGLGLGLARGGQAYGLP